MGLFGKPQQVVIFCPGLFRDGFPADGLTLDVSLAERHVMERQVTQYPVESGATISDHLQRRPQKLEISAYLTDTPSDIVEATVEAARNLQTAIAQSLDEPVVGPLASTRSKDLYRLLETLADREAVCRVVTDLRVYQDMVLLTLGVPRAPEDGRGLRVDLTFQRIIFAQTSTRAALTIEEPATSVDAPPPPEPTKNLGKTSAPQRPSAYLGRTNIAR